MCSSQTWIIVGRNRTIILHNTLCRTTTWVTRETDLIFIKGTDVKEVPFSLSINRMVFLTPCALSRQLAVRGGSPCTILAR